MVKFYIDKAIQVTETCLRSMACFLDFTATFGFEQLFLCYYRLYAELGSATLKCSGATASCSKCSGRYRYRYTH